MASGLDAESAGAATWIDQAIRIHMPTHICITYIYMSNSRRVPAPPSIYFISKLASPTGSGHINIYIYIYIFSDQRQADSLFHTYTHHSFCSKKASEGGSNDTIYRFIDFIY